MGDPYLISGLAVAVFVGAFLLYVVLSHAAHRQKWLTAMDTGQALLRGNSEKDIDAALADEKPGRRLGAIMALADDASAPAGRKLAAALQDEDEDVRSAAANALARQKREGVVEPLARAALGDPSFLVRGAAIGALGETAGEEAVDALVEVLREGAAASIFQARRGRMACAAMAAEALGKIGGAKAAAALGAAQASPRRPVRLAAQTALGLMNLTDEASSELADAPVVRKLAAALIAKGDDEQAIKWLWRAAELDPGDASTHHTLGVMHQRLGDYVKAEKAYGRAIELDPKEPFPHFGMGMIYQSRNQFDKARAAFTQYLRLAPRGDQARSARQFLREIEEMQG
ncbi:MAG: HEAT repeat domain-containing protein [Armatimonadota bacterium]